MKAVADGSKGWATASAAVRAVTLPWGEDGGRWSVAGLAAAEIEDAMECQGAPRQRTAFFASQFSDEESHGFVVDTICPIYTYSLHEF